MYLFSPWDGAYIAINFEALAQGRVGFDNNAAGEEKFFIYDIDSAYKMKKTTSYSAFHRSQ